jgi:hypothetical protein
VSETISASSVVPNSSYLPRVGTYDSRAIELALAGSTLFERGVRLEGALVEASFANREPPLLKRLREDEVPFLVDVQALRFATDAYLDIEAVAGLPFSPDAALTPTSTTPDVEKLLAHGALIFQQRMGARRYVAPALPLLNAELPAWLDINTRLLSHASNANGGSSVDRRPLLAMVAPARKALANPNLIVPRLLDSPIDGVYVQSLNLRPTRDSVEKLAQYVKFLAKLKETGLPVVAGRV